MLDKVRLASVFGILSLGCTSPVAWAVLDGMDTTYGPNNYYPDDTTKSLTKLDSRFPPTSGKYTNNIDVYGSSTNQSPAQLVYGNDSAVKNRVNLIFFGDGYIASEMNIFDADVKSAVAPIFNPTAGDLAKDQFLSYYKSFFNVYKIEAVSSTSTAGKNDTDYNASSTAYGTSFVNGTATYDRNGVARLSSQINRGNFKFTSEYGKRTEVGTILGNTGMWGGSYGGDGGYITIGGHSTSGDTNMTSVHYMHELGHALGNLADEYLAGADGKDWGNANVSKDPEGKGKWDNWAGYQDSRGSQYDILPGGTGYEAGETFGAKPAGTTPGFTGNYTPSSNNKMRWMEDGFDAVSREQMILSIYETVRPLDDFTGRAAYIASGVSSAQFFDTVVLNTTIDLENGEFLYAQSVDDAVLSIEWYFGEGASKVHITAADGVTEFDPSLYGYTGTGLTFTLHCFDADENDWVRSSLEGTYLHQWVVWTNVNVGSSATIPEPASILLLTVGGMGLLLRRRRIGG